MWSTLIIEFNITAQTLAHGAKEMAIPFVILEEDAQIVEEQSHKGWPMVFGGAAYSEVLQYVNIKEASDVVIAGADVDHNQATIASIRHLHPTVYILARAQTTKDAKKLKKAGATEVLIDEVEMNLSMLVQILDRLELPTHEAYKFASIIREEAE